MFPLREFLGMSIGRADGHASAVMEIDARHLNRNGVAHGAALFPLIDTVMGAATVGPVEPSSSTVCRVKASRRAAATRHLARRRRSHGISVHP
jgi:uncharacterized protein (TIGR00369 family)